MKHFSANQNREAPPFSSDFLRRYEVAHRPHWRHSHWITQRVSIRRFDEWLKVSKAPLSELNWQRLLDMHRFLAAQGLSSRACKKSVQLAKHALYWGIRQGELSQKVESLYTHRHQRHAWSDDLPAASLEFLGQLEATHPGAYRTHRYAHRVFHTFLSEKNITYRRFRPEHGIAFVKYVQAKGFQQRTRMALCSHVRTYLRWLSEKRKIRRRGEDLFPSRIIPKPPQSLPRPLDPEIDAKLQKILRETDDLIYKSILLLRRTGLRILELRKLGFDCIQTDLKGRASLKVPVVKLGLERRVPLDTETIALIRQIQVMSRANFKKKVPPQLLIIGSSGLPPRYEVYSDALTELCAKLNTPKWINLHALRHTYATSLLNAGVSITSLKELLGHKTIIMTLVYAKVTQEKIHAEYTEALTRMGDGNIPHLLMPRPQSNLDAAFATIGALIAKSTDATADPARGRELKALQNRLSKIKSALIRA